MTEAETRAAIVAEALSWERTPYMSHARLKGVGVDCAMLPAAVYEAVGIIPQLNPTYTADWMMHRDEEQFLGFVLPHAHEIPECELQPGDLVIWKFGRTFSHSAIVIDYPTVLHAVIRGGAVIRADMTQDVDLIDRPRKCFSVFAAPE
jgi:cell wall-associated NlpC family hydrolase